MLLERKRLLRRLTCDLRLRGWTVALLLFTSTLLCLWKVIIMQVIGIMFGKVSDWLEKVLQGSRAYFPVFDRIM